MFLVCVPDGALHKHGFYTVLLQLMTANVGVIALRLKNGRLPLLVEKVSDGFG